MAHHRDHDSCDLLCNTLGNLSFRKPSKHCFYEDYALLRNQLLQLEYNEDYGYVCTKLSDIVNKLKRFIEDTPKSIQETVTFIENIRKLLIFLCEIFHKSIKIGLSYSSIQELHWLLVSYVELEYQGLYVSENLSSELQTKVENRVLTLLLMFDHERDRQQTENLSALNALYIITHVKLEYKKQENFIENVITKLLRKLNVFDKVTDTRSKNKTYNVEKVLKIPEIQKVNMYFKQRDSKVDDFDLSDDVEYEQEKQIYLSPLKDFKCNIPSCATLGRQQEEIITIVLDDETDSHTLHDEPVNEPAHKWNGSYFDHADSNKLNLDTVLNNMLSLSFSDDTVVALDDDNVVDFNERNNLTENVPSVQVLANLEDVLLSHDDVGENTCNIDDEDAILNKYNDEENSCDNLEKDTSGKIDKTKESSLTTTNKNNSCYDIQSEVQSLQKGIAEKCTDNNLSKASDITISEDFVSKTNNLSSTIEEITNSNAQEPIPENQTTITFSQGQNEIEPLTDNETQIVPEVPQNVEAAIDDRSAAESPLNFSSHNDNHKEGCNVNPSSFTDFLRPPTKSILKKYRKTSAELSNLRIKENANMESRYLKVKSKPNLECPNPKIKQEQNVTHAQLKIKEKRDILFPKSNLKGKTDQDSSNLKIEENTVVNCADNLKPQETTSVSCPSRNVPEETNIDYPNLQNEEKQSVECAELKIKKNKNTSHPNSSFKEKTNGESPNLKIDENTIGNCADNLKPQETTSVSCPSRNVPEETNIDYPNLQNEEKQSVECAELKIKKNKNTSHPNSSLKEKTNGESPNLKIDENTIGNCADNLTQETASVSFPNHNLPEGTNVDCSNLQNEEKQSVECTQLNITKRRKTFLNSSLKEKTNGESPNRKIDENYMEKCADSLKTQEPTNIVCPNLNTRGTPDVKCPTKENTNVECSNLNKDKTITSLKTKEITNIVCPNLNTRGTPDVKCPTKENTNVECSNLNKDKTITSLKTKEITNIVCPNLNTRGTPDVKCPTKENTNVECSNLNKDKTITSLKTKEITNIVCPNLNTRGTPDVKCPTKEITNVECSNLNKDKTITSLKTKEITNIACPNVNIKKQVISETPQHVEIMIDNTSAGIDPLNSLYNDKNRDSSKKRKKTNTKLSILKIKGKTNAASRNLKSKKKTDVKHRNLKVKRKTTVRIKEKLNISYPNSTGKEKTHGELCDLKVEGNTISKTAEETNIPSNLEIGVETNLKVACYEEINTESLNVPFREKTITECADKRKSEVKIKKNRERETIAKCADRLKTKDLHLNVDNVEYLDLNKEEFVKVQCLNNNKIDERTEDQTGKQRETTEKTIKEDDADINKNCEFMCVNTSVSDCPSVSVDTSSLNLDDCSSVGNEIEVANSIVACGPVTVENGEGINESNVLAPAVDQTDVSENSKQSIGETEVSYVPNEITEASTTSECSLYEEQVVSENSDKIEEPSISLNACLPILHQDSVDVEDVNGGSKGEVSQGEDTKSSLIIAGGDEETCREAAFIDVLQIQDEVEVSTTECSPFDENDDPLVLTKKIEDSNEHNLTSMWKVNCDDQLSGTGYLNLLSSLASKRKKIKNPMVMKMKKKIKEKVKRTSRKVELAESQKETKSCKQQSCEPTYQNCDPSSFMNLESLVTPTHNRVYNLIEETTICSEDSADENFLEIPQSVTDNPISIFDEDTVDLGITFVCHKKTKDSNKEVVISIPDSKNNFSGLNFSIVERVETFVDKTSDSLLTKSSQHAETINTICEREREVSIVRDASVLIDNNSQPVLETVKTIGSVNSSLPHIRFDECNVEATDNNLNASPNIKESDKKGKLSNDTKETIVEDVRFVEYQNSTVSNNVTSEISAVQNEETEKQVENSSKPIEEVIEDGTKNTVISNKRNEEDVDQLEINESVSVEHKAIKICDENCSSISSKPITEEEKQTKSETTKAISSQVEETSEIQNKEKTRDAIESQPEIININILEINTKGAVKNNKTEDPIEETDKINEVLPCSTKNVADGEAGKLSEGVLQDVTEDESSKDNVLVEEKLISTLPVDIEEKNIPKVVPVKKRSNHGKKNIIINKFEKKANITVKEKNNSKHRATTNVKTITRHVTSSNTNCLNNPNENLPDNMNKISLNDKLGQNQFKDGILKLDDSKFSKINRRVRTKAALKQFLIPYVRLEKVSSVDIETKTRRSEFSNKPTKTTDRSPKRKRSVVKEAGSSKTREESHNKPINERRKSKRRRSEKAKNVSENNLEGFVTRTRDVVSDKTQEAVILRPIDEELNASRGVFMEIDDPKNGRERKRKPDNRIKTSPENEQTTSLKSCHSNAELTIFRVEKQPLDEAICSNHLKLEETVVPLVELAQKPTTLESIKPNVAERRKRTRKSKNAKNTCFMKKVEAENTDSEKPTVAAEKIISETIYQPTKDGTFEVDQKKKTAETIKTPKEPTGLIKNNSCIESEIDLTSSNIDKTSKQPAIPDVIAEVSANNECLGNTTKENVSLMVVNVDTSHLNPETPPEAPKHGKDARENKTKENVTSLVANSDNDNFVPQRKALKHEKGIPVNNTKEKATSLAVNSDNGNLKSAPQRKALKHEKSIPVNNTKANATSLAVNSDNGNLKPAPERKAVKHKKSILLSSTKEKATLVVNSDNSNLAPEAHPESLKHHKDGAMAMVVDSDNSNSILEAEPEALKHQKDIPENKTKETSTLLVVNSDNTDLTPDPQPEAVKHEKGIPVNKTKEKATLLTVNSGNGNLAPAPQRKAQKHEKGILVNKTKEKVTSMEVTPMVVDSANGNSTLEAEPDALKHERGITVKNTKEKATSLAVNSDNGNLAPAPRRKALKYEKGIPINKSKEKAISLAVNSDKGNLAPAPQRKALKHQNDIPENKTIEKCTLLIVNSDNSDLTPDAQPEALKHKKDIPENKEKATSLVVNNHLTREPQPEALKLEKEIPGNKANEKPNSLVVSFDNSNLTPDAQPEALKHKKDIPENKEKATSLVVNNHLTREPQPEAMKLEKEIPGNKANEKPNSLVVSFDNSNLTPDAQPEALKHKKDIPKNKEKATSLVVNNHLTRAPQPKALKLEKELPKNKTKEKPTSLVLNFDNSNLTPDAQPEALKHQKDIPENKTKEKVTSMVVDSDNEPEALKHQKDIPENKTKEKVTSMVVDSDNSNSTPEAEPEVLKHQKDIPGNKTKEKVTSMVVDSDNEPEALKHQKDIPENKTKEKVTSMVVDSDNSNSTLEAEPEVLKHQKDIPENKTKEKVTSMVVDSDNEPEALKHQKDIPENKTKEKVTSMVVDSDNSNSTPEAEPEVLKHQKDIPGNKTKEKVTSMVVDSDNEPEALKHQKDIPENKTKEKVTSMVVDSDNEPEALKHQKDISENKTKEKVTSMVVDSDNSNSTPEAEPEVLKHQKDIPENKTKEKVTSMVVDSDNEPEALKHQKDISENKTKEKVTSMVVDSDNSNSALEAEPEALKQQKDIPENKTRQKPTSWVVNFDNSNLIPDAQPEAPKHRKDISENKTKETATLLVVNSDNSHLTPEAQSEGLKHEKEIPENQENATSLVVNSDNSNLTLDTRPEALIHEKNIPTLDLNQSVRLLEEKTENTPENMEGIIETTEKCEELIDILQDTNLLETNENRDSADKQSNDLHDTNIKIAITTDLIYNSTNSINETLTDVIEDSSASIVQDFVEETIIITKTTSEPLQDHNLKPSSPHDFKKMDEENPETSPDAILAENHLENSFSVVTNSKNKKKIIENVATTTNDKKPELSNTAPIREKRKPRDLLKIATFIASEPTTNEYSVTNFKQQEENVKNTQEPVNNHNLVGIIFRNRSHKKRKERHRTKNKSVKGIDFIIENLKKKNEKGRINKNTGNKTKLVKHILEVKNSKDLIIPDNETISDSIDVNSTKTTVVGDFVIEEPVVPSVPCSENNHESIVESRGSALESTDEPTSNNLGQFASSEDVYESNSEVFTTEIASEQLEEVSTTETPTPVFDNSLPVDLSIPSLSDRSTPSISEKPIVTSNETLVEKMDEIEEATSVENETPKENLLTSNDFKKDSEIVDEVIVEQSSYALNSIFDSANDKSMPLQIFETTELSCDKQTHNDDFVKINDISENTNDDAKETSILDHPCLTNRETMIPNLTQDKNTSSQDITNSNIRENTNAPFFDSSCLTNQETTSNLITQDENSLHKEDLANSNQILLETSHVEEIMVDMRTFNVLEENNLVPNDYAVANGVSDGHLVDLLDVTKPQSEEVIVSLNSPTAPSCLTDNLMSVMFPNSATKLTKPQSEEVIVSLTSATTPSCVTDNLISVMFPNSEQNQSNELDFIRIFRGTDHDYHSGARDPLLNGICESERSPDISSTTEELENVDDTSSSIAKSNPEPNKLPIDSSVNVLVDDNTPPSEYATGNLNQEPNNSLTESAVDTSVIDFSLREPCLITNNLERESSPPLPQYQSNLKQGELSELIDDSINDGMEFSEDNGKVSISQFGMSTEKMYELMDVLTSIQNLNNMASQTVPCDSSSKDNAPQSPVTPKKSVDEINQTDLTNICYFPFSLHTNSTSNTKVIVEHLPYAIETNDFTSLKQNQNDAVSDDVSDFKIEDLLPIYHQPSTTVHHQEQYTIDRASDTHDLLPIIDTIQTKPKDKQQTKVIPKPVKPKIDLWEKPVVASSKTRVLAPKPKPLVESSKPQPNEAKKTQSNYQQNRNDNVLNDFKIEDLLPICQQSSTNASHQEQSTIHNTSDANDLLPDIDALRTEVKDRQQTKVIPKTILKPEKPKIALILEKPVVGLKQPSTKTRVLAPKPKARTDKPSIESSRLQQKEIKKSESNYQQNLKRNYSNILPSKDKSLCILDDFTGFEEKNHRRSHYLKKESRETSCEPPTTPTKNRDMEYFTEESHKSQRSKSNNQYSKKNHSDRTELIIATMNAMEQQHRKSGSEKSVCIVEDFNSANQSRRGSYSNKQQNESRNSSNKLNQEHESEEENTKFPKENVYRALDTMSDAELIITTTTNVVNNLQTEANASYSGASTNENERKSVYFIRRVDYSSIDNLLKKEYESARPPSRPKQKKEEGSEGGRYNKFKGKPYEYKSTHSKRCKMSNNEAYNSSDTESEGVRSKRSVSYESDEDVGRKKHKRLGILDENERDKLFDELVKQGNINSVQNSNNNNSRSRSKTNKQAENSAAYLKNVQHCSKRTTTELHSASTSTRIPNGIFNKTENRLPKKADSFIPMPVKQIQIGVAHPIPRSSNLNKKDPVPNRSHRSSQRSSSSSTSMNYAWIEDIEKKFPNVFKNGDYF